ncbi:hypothetical protein [Streptococcus pseudoporcinus]|uniref:Uncharacterized protein n=1 Tax=Streptococcus pseudoporcinus TaxID=361101 RepID=A0A4V6L0L0_9STRE|nr:hypothetical protein [Streptococcus pseudoporcinus]VTS17047.1 Uncharacterised protein [Streptococcus pseudoporcinus]VUC68165.1 Uncharacterised protein [Streptococcus pseudoporcinus]VUC99037.1 Uncharacterised protein [Streptococcus pseudoporcinus]VUC99429.1 Uncharacterised protein [Streptococcus pseudoporcinus]
MKIITQLNLFEDQELGDLEKILAVLNGLPEGRKDYSVQSLFIACIAQMVSSSR